MFGLKYTQSAILAAQALIVARMDEGIIFRVFNQWEARQLASNNQSTELIFRAPSGLDETMSVDKAIREGSRIQSRFGHFSMDPFYIPRFAHGLECVGNAEDRIVIAASIQKLKDEKLI